MSSKQLTLILALILGGCSKHQVNIKGVPKAIAVDVKPIEVSVRFEIKEASEVCDQRFGVGTELSNKCFLAYLEALKITISLDMSSIIEYCEERYKQSQSLEDQCVADLGTLLSGLGRL